jgi:hypothetical protein
MNKTTLIVLLIISHHMMGQDYSKNRIPCERVVYPIHYYHVLPPHFIKPSKDTSSLNITALITGLNDQFKKTCIEFKLCKVDTIRDYNYNFQEDDPNTPAEDDDLLAMNYDQHSINVYRIKDTIKESFFGICWEKQKYPRVLLTYSDNPMIDISTLNKFTVQMCHYFGLSNTNSDDMNKEWVNTLNSSIKADSIWDTPADPLSFVINPISDTMVYPGTTPPFQYYYSNRKDVNNEYYNPMVYNLMSDNKIGMADRCIELTHEQYQKIIRNERMCRKRFNGVE